ncbi:(deoxy)nucleoside triphosphate pyrophosphohydrolase [Geobacter sp. DSM 9736]|uniref:(deoxy)nucleoside triphosphate pyrophosphohydrolase n=1 Tax=Geobacter sp. DSM 9736 TaxID=1277350 RepID=UPI000B504D8E|nr:(deoxy)nucleoside triphosphate pyrophosphohydrolase [Geobacter sp. DSM 9736]SNB46346.1 8-oxo-dGTP diphosphatase [Geobacter sp. DSM 9736]
MATGIDSGYPLLVTAAVIEHEGKVLLTRRRPDAPYPLLWELPGGKLEPHEDPAECIVRELREELGIDVVVEGIFDVVYHRYPERTVLILAYRCRWTGGNIVELEVAGHCWVAPEKLLTFPLLSADIPLVERLAREYSDAGCSCL